jgi:hypothetical protein
VRCTRTNIIKVGGVPLPSPTSFEWRIEDITSNSGRTLNFTYYKNRQAQKRVLNVKWTNLSEAQISMILNAVRPEYVSVAYIDARTGAERICEMVVEVGNAPLHKYTVRNKSYSSLDIKFEER